MNIHFSPDLRETPILCTLISNLFQDETASVSRYLQLIPRISQCETVQALRDIAQRHHYSANLLSRLHSEITQHESELAQSPKRPSANGKPAFRENSPPIQAALDHEQKHLSNLLFLHRKSHLNGKLRSLLSARLIRLTRLSIHQLESLPPSELSRPPRPSRFVEQS